MWLVNQQCLFSVIIAHATITTCSPHPERQHVRLLTMSVESRLRYCSFWAGVPSLANSVLISVFWMSQSTATEASTFASSSMTRMEEKNVEPVPPYCVSISMPMSCKRANLSNCSEKKEWHWLNSNGTYKWITYTLFKERFDHFLVHGRVFIHLRHKWSNALLCIFFHCQTKGRCSVFEEFLLCIRLSAAVPVSSIPAHLLPSSCSPPLSMSEGAGRWPPQLPGLKPRLGQVCWTGSSMQLGMSPMVERSVCRTESKAENCGNSYPGIWEYAQFEQKYLTTISATIPHKLYVNRLKVSLSASYKLLFCSLCSKANI